MYVYIYVYVYVYVYIYWNITMNNILSTKQQHNNNILCNPQQ